MSSLDTTNLILGVLAFTTIAQFVLILSAIVFFRRQLVQVRGAVARIDLDSLQRRMTAVTEDLHAVAAFTRHVGPDIERTVHGARVIVNRVGSGVERTSRWLNFGLGFFEGGYRQAFAVGAGLRSGVREILTGSLRRRSVAHARAGARLGAGT